MSNILLVALVALTLGCLFRGLVDTRRIFELPFLAGLIVASFVLPQAISLLYAPFLPVGAYDKTIFMTLLCFLFLLVGWQIARRPIDLLRADLSERRLMEVATVFSLIGAYFYYKLGQIPGEAIVGVQISGAPVKYLFFARLMTYGLTIACLCFARRPTKWMLAVIAIDTMFYLDRIVVTGKRAEAAELFMIFALAFWFQRGRKMSRMLLIGAVAVAVLGTASMSEYRNVTRANSGPEMSQIYKIDFVGNLTESFQDGGHELRYAMILIDHIDATSRFDYGSIHWNNLVWNYVPSRFVGADVKQELMVSTPGVPRDFQPATGSTMTGMSDAFQSFWYLGALKFFLLAYILRRIWNSAQRGDTLGQFVYILSVVPAMHAFSHQTDWVLSGWVHMLVFCTPVFAYALARPTTRHVQEA
ncbi:hypothetical protein [Qingshengfaniella alkalisoli]|uniref:Oligosaccharide repeat unit polymerase n=1 Tax=Qingshengfaniella alkalisoli TaxID=2599296 RepID=A0A5B8IWE7_9RHOB|nr:hypothetical protein [Qingshengfaniella alkalisoli]QDY70482.1 hypothetical protein FPZ52_12290 [Qingshengfaniella alkalisoli]